MQTFAGDRWKNAGDVVSGLELHMGIERVFRDINGIEWHVSYVTPGDSGEGWLSFESGHFERRLTPVSPSWATATIQRLEQMCRIATPREREQTAIVSNRVRMEVESVNEPLLDVALPESSEAPSSDVRGGEDHVSLLANAWPARESRITFRG